MSTTGALRRIADLFLLTGAVTEVEDLTPRMRRIRVSGTALRELAWLPGQHVRVRVGELALRTAFRDALRSYSVWDYDPAGHLDLCVFDHPGAGPGARWSRRVRPGEPVALTRPAGRLVARTDARHHVFVGDETASVAFGAVLRALPDSAGVSGAITAAPADRLPLARADELSWLAAGDALPALPAEPGAAYLAGAAHACQAARRHLVALGWPRGAIVVKPFWAPGKRGLD
jgi:NADPH-dependent ferric siderophore reductase